MDTTEKAYEAYEAGAMDAFRMLYGRKKKDVDKLYYLDYDRGYDDQPYGTKDYE